MSEAGLQSVVIQFGLNMVVFLDVTPVNAMRLFEVKAYGEQRRGSIGFGNGEGIGPPVDLLLCGDSEVRLFDSSVRWVFADDTQQPGTCRYARRVKT